MPELAEVRYFSQRWRPGLGKRITRVHIHAGKRVFRGTQTARLSRSLVGQLLGKIQTHGKQMMFRFGKDRWLGVHLGMTGRLSAKSAAHLPSKHDHLILYTSRHALVFEDPRLFGRIRFDRSPQPPPWWSTLPPDLFSRDFSAPRLKQILQKRSRTPLKPLFLLQVFFPGIGNWMADEILWQAGLDPRLRAGSVLHSHAFRLHRTIRKVARQALATIGKNWSDPPRSWLFAHRWSDGGRCPRCRKPLIRRPVGGRTTCWCPACQKATLPRRTR